MGTIESVPALSDLLGEVELTVERYCSRAEQVRQRWTLSGSTFVLVAQSGCISSWGIGSDVAQCIPDTIAPKTVKVCVDPLAKTDTLLAVIDLLEKLGAREVMVEPIDETCRT